MAIFIKVFIKFILSLMCAAVYIYAISISYCTYLCIELRV